MRLDLKSSNTQERWSLVAVTAHLHSGHCILTEWGQSSSLDPHESILNGCPQAVEAVWLVVHHCEDLCCPLGYPLADGILCGFSSLCEPFFGFDLLQFGCTKPIQPLLAAANRTKGCRSILSEASIQHVLIMSAKFPLVCEAGHSVDWACHSCTWGTVQVLVPQESILKPKSPLEVLDAGPQRRFVPQHPTAQGSRGRGIVPMFSHSFVSTQIPCSPSHILVLRKVTVALLSKGRYNLSPIRLDKHCIILLFSDMTLANGF